MTLPVDGRLADSMKTTPAVLNLGEFCICMAALAFVGFVSTVAESVVCKYSVGIKVPVGPPILNVAVALAACPLLSV